MSKKLFATLLFVVSAPAWALDDIKLTCAGCQSDFRSISEDIVATTDYKALGPAAATGLLGVGVGAFASYVPVDKESAWKNATGQSPSALGLVGISATKGLPLNIDVGAFYTSIPSAGVSVYGGEVRYAILPGSITLPALAVRGTYSKVSGLKNFDVDSKGLDVSVSKGFAFLTPYIGVGQVWGTSDPHGFGGLQKEDIEETRAYAGLRLGLGFLELTPEYEKIGSNDVYSLRFGFSFSL